MTITVERIEESGGATITLTNGTVTAPNDSDNTPILVAFADGDTTPKTIAATL